MRVTCGTSSANCVTDGGLGVFQVRGLVSPVAAGGLMAANDQWMRKLRLPGQLVDYSRSRLEIDETQLCGHARRVIAGDSRIGMGRPTALVVSPQDLPMWQRYCWLMAQCGVMRAAFTSQEDARRWAAEMAAIWELQAASRKPAR